MKSNVALIGFMGSGKSTVGKRLARRLGREFLDVDRLIEQHANKSIENIFREQGEAGFRDLEEDVIKELSESTSDAVIACGGGSILRQVNVDRLRQSSHIVYLEAETVTLQDRLNRSRKRPLLNRPDGESVIEELHAARQPLYEAAADVTIKTGHRPFAAVISEIVQRLGIDESRNK